MLESLDTLGFSHFKKLIDLIIPKKERRQSNIIISYIRIYTQLNNALNLLNKRKTVSDEILDYARKKGYRRNDKITNKLAADIALRHSERLLREIISTRRMIEDLI